MALRVLDGNQTATTLSSVVTGGEHIVAHSVVSLGANAIANIASAVSGSVVSISNFPASQTIAGTVTANVPLNEDTWAGNEGIKVVGNGSDGALRIGGYDPNSGGQLNLEEGGGIPIFVCGSGGGTQSLPISGTVTANVSNINLDGDGNLLVALPYTQPISGTVTVGNTVTANFPLNSKRVIYVNSIGFPLFTGIYVATTQKTESNRVQYNSTNSDAFVAYRTSDNRWYLSTGNDVGIYKSTTTGSLEPINLSWTQGESSDFPPYPTVTTFSEICVADAKISSLPAISGTVTVSQLPRVTFIDGSGSVTTANSAITVFASSTTRSYLLVQVTTGSAFVNVGATATTVNGINLTAGQGYAWETTIPQGLVSLISTTTSSRWVAKEA
jgi:hypothetical protein